MTKQESIKILWDKLTKVNGAKNKVYQLLGGGEKPIRKIKYLVSQPNYKDHEYMDLVLNSINQVLKNVITDCKKLQDLSGKLKKQNEQ